MSAPLLETFRERRRHVRVDFPEGVLLELKMTLPPSLTSIVAYGRVVDSMPHDESEPGSFSMGVDFIRLKEQDRETLIKHVARR